MQSKHSDITVATNTDILHNNVNKIYKIKNKYKT